MFCTACGAENPGEAAFCMACGKPLTALPKRGRGRRVLLVSLLALFAVFIGTSGALLAAASTTGTPPWHLLAGLSGDRKEPNPKEPKLTVTQSAWSTQVGVLGNSYPKLEGSVRNDGTEPVANVYIVGRVYGNSNDVVTQVIGAYVNGSSQPILPGETRGFSIVEFTDSFRPGRTTVTAEVREPRQRPATPTPGARR